ncbi:MAG: hypothetical protein AAFY12_10400 [Pseudomonadota bacterium]
MSKRPVHSPRVPMTLLATTALAVSNLMVGLMTGNAFLIAASAILAATFASAYAIRNNMIPSFQLIEEKETLGPSLAANRFPIWVFLALLFIAMPAMMWFLEFNGISAIFAA